MLIIHFLGLTMGVGTGFGFMFLGMASSKMGKEEARKFTLNAFSLSRMGDIGLTLLIISGLYLITPYWKDLAHMPTLIVKLSLVVILVIWLILIHRTAAMARKGDPDKYLARLKRMGPVSLFIGITIVVLAVYTFR